MKYPEKIAVTDYCSSLTYKMLDELSNSAASYLISSGVKHNDRVAVIGNRNKETVINIIGILKAGAAYVPINPQYPEERRKYIYSNSNCTFILNGDEKHQSVRDIISNDIKPSDTAYVIYTSGSTGMPKGVVISHDSACNTIIDMNERFNITSNDKFLSVSSFGFDLSVYDVFGAFAAGAEIVIAKDNKDIIELWQMAVMSSSVWR